MIKHLFPFLNNDIESKISKLKDLVAVNFAQCKYGESNSKQLYFNLQEKIEALENKIKDMEKEWIKERKKNIRPKSDSEAMLSLKDKK